MSDRDGPLWWRSLAFMGTAVVLLFSCGLLLSVAWLLGVAVRGMPAECYDGAAHLFGGLLYAILTLVLADLAYRELYLSADMEALFTMPVDDHAVFGRKLRIIIRKTYRLLAACLPFLWSFLHGLGAGGSTMAILPLWAFFCGVTMISLALVLSFFPALVRGLFWIASILLSALVLILIVSSISSDYGLVMEHVEDDPYRIYMFFWPSTWLVDGLRAWDAGDEGWALVMAACCLLFKTLAAAAVCVLSRRRYGREAVFRVHSRYFGHDSLETGRSGTNALDRYGSAPYGILDRIAGAGMTSRRRGLMRLASGNETPEKIQPVLLRILFRYGAVFLAYKAACLGLGALARGAVLTAGEVGIVCRVLFVAACVYPLLVNLTETFKGPPGVEAFRSAVQRSRKSLWGSPSQAVRTAGYQTERGTRRHPLQEIWPIGFEEYLRALSRARIVQCLLICLPLFPFSLLGPFKPAHAVAAWAALALSCLVLSMFGAVQQIREYLCHPRRSKIREVSKFCFEMLVLALSVMAVLLFAGRTAPKPFTGSLLYLGFYVLACATLLGAGVTCAVFLLTRRQHRGRWFDAEYHPYYSNRMW